MTPRSKARSAFNWARLARAAAIDARRAENHARFPLFAARFSRRFIDEHQGQRSVAVTRTGQGFPADLLGPSSPSAMRATLAQHPPSHKIIKSISFRFFQNKLLNCNNKVILKNEMTSEMDFSILPSEG